MKKHFALAFAVILLVIACKKDNPIQQDPAPPAPPVPPPNYTPMSTGSYWVYEWYVVDSSGNAVVKNITDSVYITGDTIIGSYTYAIQEGTWFGFSPFRDFLRDSSGYLANSSGRIFFSATNYTDTLYIWNPMTGQTMGYTKMNDIGEMVSVPAGTFSTLNAEYIVVNLIGTWLCIGAFDIHDNQYADNVGKVRATFQLTPDFQCRVFEQRLVHYHIN